MLPTSCLSAEVDWTYYNFQYTNFQDCCDVHLEQRYVISRELFMDKTSQIIEPAPNR